MTKRTEIQFSTFITKPIEEVYQFATTPANWVYWHPATIWVEGDDLEHSSQPEEKILEGVKIGLFRGEILWTVKENQPLKKWIFEGITNLPFNKKTRPTITYYFTSQKGGTQFTRHLTYTPPTPLVRFLDALMIKRNNRNQSRRAVSNLKWVMELPVLPDVKKRIGKRVIKVNP